MFLALQLATVILAIGAASAFYWLLTHAGAAEQRTGCRGRNEPEAFGGGSNLWNSAAFRSRESRSCRGYCRWRSDDFCAAPD
jgi:hypothetical protein